MSQLRGFGRMLRVMAQASPATAAGTCGLLAILCLLPATEMRVLQGLIDGLTGQGSPSAAGWALAFAVVVFAGGLARRSLQYLQRKLTAVGERALTERLLQAAGSCPLASFETPDYFNKLSRARAGVQRLLPQAVDLTVAIVRQGGGLIALAISLLRVHPGATLLFTGVAIPAWLLNTLVSRRHSYLYQAQSERVRRASYLAETLTERRLAPEFRLTGLSGRLLDRWQGVTDGVVSERLRLTQIRFACQVVTYGVGALAYAAAALLLGRATLAGILTIGQFAAAVRAAQSIQVDAVDTLYNANLLLFGTVFVPMYWSVVEVVPGGELSPALPTGSPEPAFAVQMDDVSFSYPGSDRPALTNVSFRARPGELVALVGENGGGKSTLVKLLLGLYSPTSGRVTVGGADPARPEAEAIRDRLAPVFQDFQRYALTAGENVGVGDIGALTDGARIAAAAAGAEAESLIAALPNGYDTLLGREFSGGHELSGGQWQRLAVARAYMRDAALLVLDEPTAALDPVAEVEVFRRFQRLSAGRTAFLVSHRLGAARFANRILVLKDGRIVEAGRHEELMARGGEYATMFAAQAQWYVEKA